LDFSDQVKRSTVIVVKVLGSVSLVGLVVGAVAKACGVASVIPQGGVWHWFTGAE